MHYDEGLLKAYLDGELDHPTSEQIQGHIQACASCRRQADELAARVEWLEGRFKLIAPQPAQEAAAVRLARIRFETMKSEKENTTMFKKIFARPYRPIWATLGVILILVVAFSFPSVRAAADNFLGLFRVETLAFVEIDPANLSQQFDGAAQLDQLIAESIQVETQGEPQEVASVDDASALAGIAVRLPQEVDGEQKLMVNPATRFTLQIDQEMVQAVMEAIGRTDIQVPAGVDGATVTVDVPEMVAATYGDCVMDAGEARQAGFDPDDPASFPVTCTTFFQLTSPTITAPPGLDIQKIGEAYLQLLGMTQEQAEKYSQNINWATTLVVPIPSAGVSYQEIPVDGVTGTLILQDQEGSSQAYLLIWVKDGILYALGGPGSGTTAVSIAETIK